MNYPLISEYIEAIKAAEENFEQLKHLRPVLDDNGQPVMTSGNFAVVFKMKDEQTGKLHAVKCFLKEQEGRAEAYRLIAEELEYVSSTFLTPIKHLDKELFVDTAQATETEFPILLMDWVEGQTLDKYIREHIDDQYDLSLLAYQFSRLAMWLMPQPFAHGDLKPDNILVRKDGTMVLVDYDGMYVPAMKGQNARELGSPDFRHPSRTEDDFDEHIDDFTLISILLSLKAIALQSELLEQYGASDRLLFSEKDYRNLSESQVMDAIKAMMQDPELATLYSLFILSSTQNNLSQASFRLLNLRKPQAPEVDDINTEERRDEDYDNYWSDEFNVQYSKDKKRLLYAGLLETDVYSIIEGTIVICNRAFEGIKYCSIQIPESVIKIGDSSFAGCELSPLSLPSSLIEIGNYAFGESTIRAIYLKEGLKKIGDDAFCLCNLISITIPHSVKELGDRVFYGCTKLVSITFLNNNIKVGKDVFLDCANLKSICVPYGYKSRFAELLPKNAGIIDEDRYDDMSEYSDPQEIDTEVTKEDIAKAWIGEYGVKYSADRKRLLDAKSDVKVFVVRYGTRVICDSAFSSNPLYSPGSYALSAITLTDGVVCIGKYAFWNCQLKAIFIPKTIKAIGEGAFGYCDELSSIIVDRKNTYYDSRNGCNAIIETFSNTLISGCKTSLIPQGVNKIGDYAFSMCKGLVSIEIPNSVIEIGKGAFFGCSDLTSIIIPNSVTTIGDSAFSHCRNLKSVSIPNSVSFIGAGAFAGCSLLSSILIPDSVNFLGNSAFEKCSSLQSVKLSNNDSVIGNMTFADCSSLEYIIIPEGVTYIEDAFGDCKNLKSISMPNSVIDIGYNAFLNCYSLKTIIIPLGTRDKFERLLPDYKDKLVEQEMGWIVKETRPFNAEEIAMVRRAEVVPSNYGNSVCFFMQAGGQTYIPLSKQSKLTVGDELDLRTAKLITLSRKGEKDIVRVIE